VLLRTAADPDGFAEETHTKLEVGCQLDRSASAVSLSPSRAPRFPGNEHSFMLIFVWYVAVVEIISWQSSNNMALESGDPRAFVLAALQGRSKGKKRSGDVPAKSALKKVDNKPLNKRQKLAAKKAKAATVIEEPEAEVGVKRLRQDALQWKLLSAQPEDFGDDFGDDIEVASDGDSQEVKKSSRKAKADPMANLFDNEGGMMMLEEVDGVDVMWEEDGKGGKKAILVVSGCDQDVVVLP
jgi:hypothetical protein